MNTLNYYERLCLQLFFPMKDTQFEALQDDGFQRICSACIAKKPKWSSKLAGSSGSLLFYCDGCKKDAESRTK